METIPRMEPNEYTVKLAAVREFESALRYKRTYEELTQAFVGLNRELMHYCEKNGIDLPDRETYYRIVEQAQRLVMSRITPGMQHDDDTTRGCNRARKIDCGDLVPKGTEDLHRCILHSQPRQKKTGISWRP